MTIDNVITQIPAGVRDLMPQEASQLRNIEKNLGQEFQAWGYQEIITPTVEFYESLAKGGDGGLKDSFFKLMDPQGRILALRPDMTTPISRVVASRLKGSSLPLRLYYLANVFRNAEPQEGRQREFYQGGIELIGSSSPEADAEVIALAVSALKAMDLTDFQINIGDVNIINGLLDEAALEEKVKAEIKDAISNRNFVLLEEIIQGLNIEENYRQAILSIATLHGGREILQKTRNLMKNEQAAKALDNLATIFELLISYGVESYVTIDLGILRGFDYYTGVVFEGYVSGIGYPICGGGRYDGLLDKYGLNLPATGFALGVERLMLALNRQGKSKHLPTADVLIGYEQSSYDMAIKETRRLRETGLKVELALGASEMESIIAKAKTKKIAKVIYCAGGQLQSIEV